MKTKLALIWLEMLGDALRKRAWDLSVIGSAVAMVVGCGEHRTERVMDSRRSIAEWRSIDSLGGGHVVLDSLRFTTHGRKFDLVILKNAEELADGPPWTWEGIRPLLLFAVTKDGGQEMVLRNDSLILCLTCGGIFGDPYAGVEFKKDTLIIHHYGGSNWRWATTHSFVYGTDGTWPLVRQNNVSYSVFEPDSTMQISNALPAAPATLATCASEW